MEGTYFNAKPRERGTWTSFRFSFKWNTANVQPDLEPTSADGVSAAALIVDSVAQAPRPRKRKDPTFWL